MWKAKRVHGRRNRTPNETRQAQSVPGRFKVLTRRTLPNMWHVVLRDLHIWDPRQGTSVRSYAKHYLHEQESAEKAEEEAGGQPLPRKGRSVSTSSSEGLQKQRLLYGWLCGLRKGLHRVQDLLRLRMLVRAWTTRGEDWVLRSVPTSMRSLLS